MRLDTAGAGLAVLVVTAMAILWLGSGTPAAHAEEHGDEYGVHIEDRILERHTERLLVRIDGRIELPNANMTVTGPGGTIEESTLLVAESGVLVGFVSLEGGTQSGLYTVQITTWDAADTRTRERTHDLNFLITDHSGRIEIDIMRNAIVACEDADTGGTEEDEAEAPASSKDGCTSPPHTTTPVGVPVRFWNNDYVTHNIRVGDVTTGEILPDGDGVLVPERADGDGEFWCTIHPWVRGGIKVVDAPEITEQIRSEAMEAATEDPLNVRDVVEHNAMYVGWSYNMTCDTCHVGVVTELDDGDGFEVDGTEIRLSLANTPDDLRSTRSIEAAAFTAEHCPLHAHVLVDADDTTPEDSRGATWAKVTCGDTVLNAELLELGHARLESGFCKKSSFAAEHWNSCPKPAPPVTVPVEPVAEIIDRIIPENATSGITDAIIPEAVTVPESDRIVIYIVIACIGVGAFYFWRKRRGNSEGTTFEFLE